ncbi:MAG TPA: hypothetical protein VIO11_11220 [Candidatus Methanoperedens sp.]
MSSPGLQVTFFYVISSARTKLEARIARGVTNKPIFRKSVIVVLQPYQEDHKEQWLIPNR